MKRFCEIMTVSAIVVNCIATSSALMLMCSSIPFFSQRLWRCILLVPIVFCVRQLLNVASSDLPGSKTRQGERGAEMHDSLWRILEAAYFICQLSLAGCLVLWVLRGDLFLTVVSRDGIVIVLAIYVIMLVCVYVRLLVCKKSKYN